MSSKKREYYLVLAVLLCVGAFALDRVVLTPLTRVWKDHARAIADLDNKIKRGVLLADREKSINDRWRGMRESSRSRDMSATEKELLDAMSRWASTSELAVTSVKPRRILDEEKCRKLEMVVSTSGKLASIVRFLYELEIDPQPLKVESVELTARDTNGQSLTCDVRLTRLVLEDGKK